MKEIISADNYYMMKLIAAIAAVFAVLFFVARLVNPASTYATNVYTGAKTTSEDTGLNLYRSYLADNDYANSLPVLDMPGSELTRYKLCLIGLAKKNMEVFEVVPKGLCVKRSADPKWTKALENQVMEWDTRKVDAETKEMHALYDNEPTPYQIEIQVQDTPSNMGVDAFLTITDTAGQNIDVTGTATIKMLYNDYPSEDLLFFEDYVQVNPVSFVSGTRGQGSFKRDTRFVQILSNLSTGRVSGKTGTVYLDFHTPTHGDFQAKTSVFFP
jgi:hypothetical protein